MENIMIRNLVCADVGSPRLATQWMPVVGSVTHWQGKMAKSWAAGMIRQSVPAVRCCLEESR